VRTCPCQPEKGSRTGTGLRQTQRVARAKIVTAVGAMRIVLSIVGLILILVGCVWFLQGVNVIRGSFMTGQIRWAVYGGIAVVVGVVVWIDTAKRRALKD